MNSAVKSNTAPPQTESPPNLPPKEKLPRKQTNSRGKPLLRVLLSAGGLGVGLATFWLMIEKAESLVRFGLTDRLFYVILLFLGLGAAAFLFGVLRSYARYRGNVLGGVLTLGGPAVLFFLVIAGGFLLVPPVFPFSVTVFVHGPGGVHDLPLRQKGFVVLDLGPDRRREAIGEKGQTHFAGIPVTFRGQEVNIGLEANDFALSTNSHRVRLDSEVLYAQVEPLPIELRGRVIDGEGRPVSGARLRLRDITATSDHDGVFSIQLPGNLTRETLALGAAAEGFEPWQAEVVPGSHGIDIVLRREKP